MKQNYKHLFVISKTDKNVCNPQNCKFKQLIYVVLYYVIGIFLLNFFYIIYPSDFKVPKSNGSYKNSTKRKYMIVII